MPENSSVPSKRLSGAQVLVVEDELLLAVELIDEIGEQGGIACGPILSVDEALTAISQRSFDAAVLNVDLRGRESAPVAEALSARRIPFIFVTGNDEFVREHFPHVPVHPKPYDMATIIDALALLLGPFEGLRPKS